MTTSGVEVFVLTRNRRFLLLETLRSIVAQVAAADRIVLLDNCSIDGTVDAVRAEFGELIEIATASRSLSAWENFGRAAELSRGSYCMIAHDDDLYHPEYLSAVSGILGAHPGIGLVVAGMSYEYDPSESRWRPLSLRGVHCRTARELALKMYNGFGVNFGSAIYSTSLLRRLSVDFGLYANYSDRPLLLEFAGASGAYVLEDRYVQYRLHRNQDSAAIGKAYPAKYLLNLQTCYRDLLLGADWKASICYRFRQVYNLRAILRPHSEPLATTLQEIRRLDTNLWAALPLGLAGWAWHVLRAGLVWARMKFKALAKL